MEQHQLSDIQKIKSESEFGIAALEALSKPHSSEFFREALRTGILEKYFRELFLAVGLQQNSYHTDDVFTHTMLALDACDELGGDLITKIAILFHDLGKVPTQKEKQ